MKEVQDVLTMFEFLTPLMDHCSADYSDDPYKELALRLHCLWLFAQAVDSEREEIYSRPFLKTTGYLLEIAGKRQYDYLKDGYLTLKKEVEEHLELEKRLKQL